MPSGRSPHTASEARVVTNTQALNTVPNSFRHEERRWSSALIELSLPLPFLTLLGHFGLINIWQSRPAECVPTADRI